MLAALSRGLHLNANLFFGLIHNNVVMVKTLLLIGLGGGAGSMLRYLSARGAANLAAAIMPAGAGSWPGMIGTLAVNVTGSFAIGAVAGLAARYGWCTPEVRSLLAAGLCGGYTTFSAFSHENAGLLLAGHYGAAALYITLSVALCIGAAIAGMALTR